MHIRAVMRSCAMAFYWLPSFFIFPYCIMELSSAIECDFLISVRKQNRPQIHKVGIS